MIPAEAVEAAAKRLASHNGTGPANWEWYANEAKAILEAAAPHLMAQAWDEGRKHGATYPYGERGLATDDNPYRTAP